MKASSSSFDGIPVLRRYLLTACLAALSSLVLFNPLASMASGLMANSPDQPGRKAVDGNPNSMGSLAVPQESRKSEKNRGLERLRRFLQLADDFLGESLAVTERECAGVEAEIDRVPLLDFPVREEDLRGLLESCQDYQSRLSETRSEIAEGQVELSSGSFPAQEWWRGTFAALAGVQEEFGGRLGRTVAAYDREEKRLAGILERRRELEDSVRSLNKRLAPLDESIRGMKEGDKGREEKLKRADRLRSDLTILQNEVLSLPLVDEGLLKHYAVLAARGRGELELLSFRIPLAAAIRDTALIVARDPSDRNREIRSAFRGFARECRRQSDRVNRKIDDAYRRRTRVTPAGTLREMDRSRELVDYYDELKGSFQSYKQYLGVLRTNLEYEITDSEAGAVR